MLNKGYEDFSTQWRQGKPGLYIEPIHHIGRNGGAHPPHQRRPGSYAPRARRAQTTSRSRKAAVPTGFAGSLAKARVSTFAMSASHT